MKGLRAIVFGATGGIGEAISKELHQRGAEIYLIGRSEEKINRLRKYLKIKSSQTYCVNSITTESGYQETQDWLVNQKVSFQIGIHCAGKAIIKKASQITTAEWQSIVDINLNSAFSFFKLFDFVRDIKQFELIYLGSAGTDQIWPKNSLYGASKAGLEIFAKTLQKEVKNQGGRVWLYKPGSVFTGFFNNIKNHLPPEKMIQPADLAKVIVDNLKTDRKLFYPEVSLLSE